MTGDSGGSEDVLTHLSVVPVSGLDPGQAERFRGWVDAIAAASRADFGDEHDAWREEELRELERSSSRPRTCAAAVVGSRVVGAAAVITPVQDNLHVAQLALSVRPEARRRGAGTALLSWAEDTAARAGRTVLQVETGWREGPDPYAAWARARGYVPALSDVRSDLDLGLEGSAERAELAARLQGVLAQVPPDAYTLETSVDGIPDGWLDDRAHLQRRMSTDAPTGDLVAEEEQWDAERVRADAARAAAMGRRTVETVARHVPSGRLVGFTHVQAAGDRPRVAYQHDTLVVREHRGSRLGLRLKAANALALLEAVPPVRVVRTWNAEVNAPMLAVNRALGYRVSGYETEWQKRLVALS